MRQVLSGAGVDTSAAVIAWLKAHKTLTIANLYLIGEPDDPHALWLTDWESSLVWAPWGTFRSANIKRGNVSSKIGLEAEVLQLTWSPLNTAITASLATASPYQKARLGLYDGKRVRVWRTYMPTPGDADTFGAMELFAGWIGDVSTTLGSIEFSVNSYLYALNQKVPTGIIEVTNTLASYSGGALPPGYPSMPSFYLVTPLNTETVIYGWQKEPFPERVATPDSLNGGFVVFSAGPGATMAGIYSAIGRNSDFYYAPTNQRFTQIQLDSPLPWVPTAFVDNFYVCARAPINQADGDYYGFPYVPAPETAA